MSTVTVIKRKTSSQFRLEQLESDDDREHQEPLNLPEAVGTSVTFCALWKERIGSYMRMRRYSTRTKSKVS